MMPCEQMFPRVKPGQSTCEKCGEPVAAHVPPSREPSFYKPEIAERGNAIAERLREMCDA